METVRGKVSRILFKGKDSNYTVISVETPSGNTVITGEFESEIIPEIVADFHGEYKTHPKYGYQFRAYSFEPTYSESDLSSIKLFISTIAKWIGPERANAIVNHFGTDTIKILDEDPSRLEEVYGVGEVSTSNIIEAWKEGRKEWEENKTIYSFKTFLHSLGLKEGRVKRIIKYLGGNRTEEKVRENPYILIEIGGFGFSTADFIAKRLGVTENSPFRLKAFVHYIIKDVCENEGHLYYTEEDVLGFVNKYIQENETPFIGKFHISIDDLSPMLTELEKEKLIVIEDKCIYAKHNHKHESISASVLAHTMKKKSDLIFLTKESIDEFITSFEKENNIDLSKEQKDALYMFAEQKVMVITGSPGTGKTTILKAIVAIIKNLGLSMAALTPTGISAKKLSLTIDYPAYTIHRMLGFRGDTWMYNEAAPFRTDVVIVDEASMVDQEVLYHLLIALEKRTHIVFVGDHNQLPSVGAGNVLRDLINCDKIPVVRLEQIFRQKEASDIIKIAHKIKEGENCLNSLGSDPKDDIFFIRLTETEAIEKYIIALASKFKEEKRLFQIITPRNNGPLSIETLNTTLQNLLNPPPAHGSGVEIKCGKFTVRKGDRVIVTKNDYENDIYNGDIGKVKSISRGTITLLIDDRLVEIDVEEAEEKIKLAYAITVHKSQGLEYPMVIMPFIKQYGQNMLQRNLLYTGITRAKEKVILLGHGSAIEKAISNATVTKRNTRFGERIIKNMSSNE